LREWRAFYVTIGISQKNFNTKKEHFKMYNYYSYQQPQQPYPAFIPPALLAASQNRQEFLTPEGKKYYYNRITQQTQWDKPQELIERDKVCSFYCIYFMYSFFYSALTLFLLYDQKVLDASTRSDVPIEVQLGQIDNKFSGSISF
jgi:hypothetical protein